MFRLFQVVLVGLAFLLNANALACSSSSTQAGPGGGGSGASCGDVCAKIQSLCGFSPPDCASGCENDFGASRRNCIVSSNDCATAGNCEDEAEDDAGSPKSDATTNKDGSNPTHPCDGTSYCEDNSTSAVCENNVTRRTSCKGRACAGGRCGACSGAGDCTGISYRCKCANGTEKTGVVNGICGDSSGSQKWCSHPSIDESICGGAGFDTSFGYHQSGCISDVDP